MSWARIDDGFDDHPKVLALLEHEQGLAAIGLWALCLAYAHRHRRRNIPRGVLPRAAVERLGIPASTECAALLVQTGFWRGRGDSWLVCDEPDLFRWGTPRYLMPWIPRTTRTVVYNRDGYTCKRCERSLDLTIDHIWPRSRGGGDTEDNLQTLCRSCNSRKGARI